MTISEIGAIIAAIGGLIVSILAFTNQKKQVSNDSTKTLIENAIEISKQVEPLTERIRALEEQNETFRNKITLLSGENSVLKDKIFLLERALVESPLYHAFFDIAPFPCVIFSVDDGKIFDANASFTNLLAMESVSSSNIYEMSGCLEDLREKIISGKEEVDRAIFLTPRKRPVIGKMVLVYYSNNNVDYCLGVYIVNGEEDIESRAGDMLSELIRHYNSDYATIWKIHNHGTNKLSAEYEIARKGNDYLLQDYQNLPTTIFGDLFRKLSKNGSVYVNEKNTTDDATILTLQHAGLESILAAGIFDDGKNLVGLITTSWKSELSDSLPHDMIKKFADSDLAKNALEQSK